MMRFLTQIFTRDPAYANTDTPKDDVSNAADVDAASDPNAADNDAADP